jgi:hypothetical protein
LFGLDVLTLHISTDSDEQGAPDAMSFPVGFVQSPGDQAWETGVER